MPARTRTRHEEEKEIEEAEVARVAGLVAHIADGVDVDEEADSHDHQEHDRGKLIEDEGEIDVKGADGEPWIGERFDSGEGERGDRTAAATA